MGAIERSDFPIHEESANEPELLKTGKPIVSVERGDKTIENDWVLEGIDEGTALVAKIEAGTGRRLSKRITLQKLEELNPELNLKKE